MKYIIATIVLCVSFLANAKTIKEGDTEYQCVPKKSCEDKLKDLQRQVKELKRQLKEAQSDIIEEPFIVEKEVRVTKIKKHILSVYGHRDLTNVQATVNGNQANAVVETRYLPGLSYQYQMDVGLVPMVGVNTAGHMLFGLGLEF